MSANLTPEERARILIDEQLVAAGWVLQNRQKIDLVNYVQTIPYDNKQQLYQIYREMIPKAKTFLKYIKTKNQKKPATLIEYVSKHFECSLGEAEEYIDILREVGTRRVLYDMGLEDKEIKKLLK